MNPNKYNRTAAEQDAFMAEIWCLAWHYNRHTGVDMVRAFQLARRLLCP